MEKVWLTEQLDRTPYFYNEQELVEITNRINNKKEQIERYLDAHPKLKEQLYSEKRRVMRFRRSAFSYLSIDSNGTLDIVPSIHKSEAEREFDQQQINQLLAYQKACQMAHEFAHDENVYLDEKMFVRLHTQLCQGNEEKRNFVRPRLRNDDDPTIMIGKGYFEPVDGSIVSLRVSMLLFNYLNHWEHDNVFAKGAKFMTEYVRIQPHLDGNKRVALMLLNYILEKHDYTDIYFAKKQMDELYENIQEAMITRDVTNFAKFIALTTELYYDNVIEKIKDYRIEHLEDLTSRL